MAPAFLARAAASQPLTNAVFTKLNFGTEVFDTANNFASSRFTPTVPGKYLLTATMAMDLGGLVDAIIIIYKNGTPYAWGNRIGQVSTAQYPTVSVVADANGTTDYFEVYGWQNNGGGSTVNLLGDPLRTYFSGALLPAFTGAAGVGNQWATNGSSIYYNGGNVGIGYSAPQTTLDVNGYGRFGSGGVVQGGSCSPEGALAFDISHHVPVYCSSSLVWKGYGGAGSYQLHLCYLGTFYPSGSSDCRLPNPYTGSCSCLPGYTAYHSNDFDIPLHSCPQTYYENAGMIEYSCY